QLYTLSLHDALPILRQVVGLTEIPAYDLIAVDVLRERAILPRIAERSPCLPIVQKAAGVHGVCRCRTVLSDDSVARDASGKRVRDRKRTRLNSSHVK